LSTLWTGILPWMIRRKAIDGAADTRPRELTRSRRHVAPRWMRVKIDISRLRHHLAPEADVNETQLKRWLERSGFQPQGDWWLVEESKLGQLAPSEVAEAELVEIAI
jgi:hypothetical protein